MNLQNQKLEYFKSREFYQDDAERFMSHCLLDDEVALVAYQQQTVEELVINVWQQKGGDRIGFKSRQNHTLDDVTSRFEQMNTRETTTPSTPDKKSASTIKYATLLLGTVDVRIFS